MLLMLGYIILLLLTNISIIKHSRDRSSITEIIVLTVKAPFVEKGGITQGSLE